VTATTQRRRSLEKVSREVPRGGRDLLALACATLLLARWLVPAESADVGDTLWIALAWLLLSAAAIWLASRAGPLQLRWNWETGTLGVLVASMAICRPAQWRFACNLIWEWVAIVVGFVLIAHVFDNRRYRVRLAKLLLTAGVLLAGLGLWQRTIWYPATAAEYLEWEQLNDASRSGTVLPSESRARLDQLQTSLGPELLAFDGPSRLALRQRILNSTEPFGRFALGNTFAGVLAVVGLLLGGWLWMSWGEWSPARRATAGIALALVVGVLVLTKSRTAWVGCLGGATYLLLWSSSGASRVRTCFKLGVLIACLGVGIAITAVAAGVIDREVITEAPKSLQYRWQYWSATARVIGDHWWQGVGPGNFRQHYLRYKLPEASEEIADPHNLFLDIWVTGGLVAFGGLLWLIALWWREQRRAQRLPAATPRDETSTRTPGDARWLALAGLFAAGLVFAESLCFRGRFDEQVLWLGIAWLPLAWGMDRLLGHTEAVDPRRWNLITGAAGLALLIHLCGAGGISMPAITQLLLLLWFILPERTTDVSHVYELTHAESRVGIVLALVLSIGCLWTAWLPVSLARIEMSNGHYAQLVDRRLEQAADHYEAAIAADGIDPEPWRDLAFVQWDLARRRPQDADRHFEAARLALERAIELDRENAHRWAELGQLHLTNFHRTQLNKAAEEAVTALTRARDLYPNSSRIRFDRSEALEAANRLQESASEAAEALRLDDINRAAGHSDKYLSEAQRIILNERTSQRP
jgi:hypothetical protein